MKKKLSIRNYQPITTMYASDNVDISEEDIEDLRNWEAFPYRGTTNQELVQYIASLLKNVKDGSALDGTPPIVDTLLDSLRDDVHRTEVATTADWVSESKLILKEANQMDCEAESKM